jgi:hypothetical protein
MCILPEIGRLARRRGRRTIGAYSIVVSCRKKTRPSRRRCLPLARLLRFFGVRDHRHIPPRRQLADTIHGPSVRAEGLAEWLSCIVAFSDGKPVSIPAFAGAGFS